jgi:DNA-binding transcriptional ArsR family regulator
MIRADQQDDAVFKALGDATRRRALDLLREGPMTTGELCARLERHPAGTARASTADSLGRTGVLRHLAVLMDAGLVVTRTEGRVRWNHLNGAPLQRVCDRWMSRHVQAFASAFNRLKAVAESDNADEPTPTPPAANSPHRDAGARTPAVSPARRTPASSRSPLRRKERPHV